MDNYFGPERFMLTDVDFMMQGNTFFHRVEAGSKYIDYTKFKQDDL